MGVSLEGDRVANSWDTWKNHVLAELDRNNEAHKEIKTNMENSFVALKLDANCVHKDVNGRIDNLDMKLDALVISVSMMGFQQKFIAGVTGAVVGFVPSIVSLIIMLA